MPARTIEPPLAAAEIAMQQLHKARLAAAVGAVHHPAIAAANLQRELAQRHDTVAPHRRAAQRRPAVRRRRRRRPAPACRAQCDTPRGAPATRRTRRSQRPCLVIRPASQAAQVGRERRNILGAMRRQHPWQRRSTQHGQAMLHAFAIAGIQSVERFIQQQQLGPPCQRTRQQHQTALAVRQRQETTLREHLDAAAGAAAARCAAAPAA